MASESVPLSSTPKTGVHSSVIDGSRTNGNRLVNGHASWEVCFEPSTIPAVEPVSPTLGALLCKETLGDRSSPELWPEMMPGLRDFLVTHSSPMSPVELADPEWLCDLDSDEMNLLYALGSLTGTAILDKVKEYHNLAYELGIEESREMARGKMLQVLGQPNTGKKEKKSKRKTKK